MTPTAEPFVPRPLRLFDDSQKTNEVSADTEVVEVTLDASRERLVLSRNG
jgi:hypothetical protein